ncbi:MAG: MlaA family lipoprotein, partial [Pseudomonadota bacterium]|nr:MlaA family lipoprotein [Pseudomonadota bacterium]
MDVWPEQCRNFLCRRPGRQRLQGGTPNAVQGAVSNAVSNLAEPINAGASLPQGDTENASAATKRFMTNSTVGLAGMQDKASEMGIEARQEDVGQPLCSHGVGTEPQIVLPLLGPSNLRDATDTTATSFAIRCRLRLEPR